MTAVNNIARFYQWGKKIVGVGMNYKGMLERLGAKAPPEPRLFLKPSTSYICSGQPILIPSTCKDGLYYEVELGVVIGKKANKISPDQVMEHVAGYCTALDMTCVTAINEARKLGLSWDIAKGFDTSTLVGDFVPQDNIKDPDNINMWLKLNDKLVNEGNTNDMVYKLPELISFMSHCFTLEPGDLILSGAPDQGPCFTGDRIEACVENIGTVKTSLKGVCKVHYKINFDNTFIKSL